MNSNLTRSPTHRATASEKRSHALWSFGWSGAFLLVTRLSAVLAVPLVLHSLGPALYGVWVVGGALIMIQGLFDLGIGAALVRYVAVEASRGSRSAVLIVLRRGGAFYVALSVAISLPLWVFADEIASLFPSVHASATGEAASLLRYVAVSFALTNVALVLASLLQGVNRVDAAYRDQTLGWLLYVPLLAIGLQFGQAVHVVGLAWVGAYTLQLLLLSVSSWSAVRRLPRNTAPAPSLGEMFLLGGWWQLSSWADFATFQLPRLLGAFILPATSLVELDVALRAAQVVVAPFFAAYPLVLPAATEEWTVRGFEGLRVFLDRWFLPAASALWVASTTFIPIERTALAAWTGSSARSFDLWVSASVLLGVAAHASTGLFSSARLATGIISSVVHYKVRQLVLALVLVPAGLVGGVETGGIALGVSLALPALAFNRDEARVFRLRLPSRRSRFVRRLVLTSALAVPLLSVVSWLSGKTLPAWASVAILFPLWAGLCLAAWWWCWRSWTASAAAPALRASTGVERAAS
jgi:O-antigen/teichoic acid export membrane protein